MNNRPPKNKVAEQYKQFLLLKEYQLERFLPFLNVLLNSKQLVVVLCYVV